ncbi:class I SAM-dependent methyltransferase [Rhabdothermincola salaria]|uniref:class I SAM-dependent methyltransferase n=1 Tax=Rhabdothermincola salaria TaxID=2903142 RepID=UPI001E59E03F|nr:class I SAM-dependent methyltransferase [Rhabdothermincola salaria]MCD9622585.1 class I SAM-dependent methyltransferase [Rhabdothermincola salaria]
MDRTRLQREQEFHDERFTDDGERAAAKKYYAVTRASSMRMDQILEMVPAGARALELGCGLHNHAVQLAQRGVDVVAVDISPVAALQMRQQCESLDLPGRVSVEVMNAEELAFEDQAFDLVVGTGILHHLDLDRAYPELARVLRSGGKGAFIEPLGRNPLINLYRRMTPRMRTPDEHPLVESDFDDARRWFDEVEVDYYHTLSLAAVPLRRLKAFDVALKRLEEADAWMYERIPRSRALAWSCVVELSGTKPAR